ncbi:MAG TPA: hypothetical protein DD444_01390 [Citreicella sp.]|nr:hypothetical protein [Citreicella sp.]
MQRFGMGVHEIRRQQHRRLHRSARRGGQQMGAGQEIPQAVLHLAQAGMLQRPLPQPVPSRTGWRTRPGGVRLQGHQHFALTGEVVKRCT